MKCGVLFWGGKAADCVDAHSKFMAMKSNNKYCNTNRGPVF